MTGKEDISNEIWNYPKMSDTVEVVSTPDESKPYFLIKNNRTSKFLKIGSNEYEILTSSDGVNSLNDILQKYKDRFEPQAIHELIGRFYKMRLLEQDCINEEEEKKVSVIHRFIMNFTYEKIFKIKLKLIEPDKIMTKVHRFFKFFFSRPGAIAGAILSLYGIAMFVFNFNFSLNIMWEEVANGEVLILILPYVAVLCMHEFAHGIATKQFGGVIYDMGFMFYYFRPAFYCNVTDSYRFTTWRRIVVAGAGIYFQLVLASLFMVGYQVAGYPLNLVGRLVITFVFLNMFNSALNFIPLIKLDGYWMLTALSNIDNLRQKSFDYLSALLFNRLLGTAKSNYIIKQSSAKEKAIYIIYGITAIIFTFAIIAVVVVRFGLYLVLRFGRIGFILFLALMLAFLLKALIMVFKSIISVFKGGLKPIVRLVLIIVLAVASCMVLFKTVTVDFTVEAMYRLIDENTAAGNNKMALPSPSSPNSTLVKIFLSQSDLEYVKKGQEIKINIYKNGNVSRFKGSIISEKSQKELYFNTSLNVTANPGLFVGEEKNTIIAEVKNTDTFFKKFKSGTVEIMIGKKKLGGYLAGVFHKLTPS